MKNREYTIGIDKMEYSMWEPEPMGPVMTGYEQPQMTQQGGNGYEAPNPVQKVVMDSRPTIMPLGNGTPAVSAPPMAAEQTRKPAEASYMVPAVVAGGAAVGVALTQPALNNVGYYANVEDVWYIVLAVLIVEVIVLFMTRYYPNIMGSNLNRWYTSFGLNAVLADVLILVLVFFVARYVYTNHIEPNVVDRSWSPWIFLGVFVALGVIHDAAFYKLVIQNLSRGTNTMIDLMKDYSEAAGANAIFGDALMVAGSGLLAMILKGQPAHATTFLGFLAAYCIPYILHTRPGAGISTGGGMD
jgi:hypothetical protein